jgi:hypothetical protein
MPVHIVKPSESLSGIAKQYGLSHWALIYWHPLNEKIQETRPNPDLIMPGDRLHVPEPGNATVTGFISKIAAAIPKTSHHIKLSELPRKLEVQISNPQGKAHASVTMAKGIMSAVKGSVSAAARNRAVTLRVTVENESHWESGTRVPKTFQNAGLPKYLIPDKPRKTSIIGGSFKQQFIWTEPVKY